MALWVKISSSSIKRVYWDYGRVAINRMIKEWKPIKKEKINWMNYYWIDYAKKENKSRKIKAIITIIILLLIAFFVFFM